jgi:hypothetical protein
MYVVTVSLGLCGVGSPECQRSAQLQCTVLLAWV